MFDSSPRCVFKCLQKNLGQCMQSRPGYIYLIFFHVFSNVSSLHLDSSKHFYIGCICLIFLHCVFSNVSSNCLPTRMQSHTACICSNFLHCALQDFAKQEISEEKEALPEHKLKTWYNASTHFVVLLKLLLS